MIFFYVVFIFFPYFNFVYTQSPLSRVMVTSNKMTCSPLGNQDKDYSISYTENVKVVLADGSIITADKLEIIMKHGTFSLGVDKKSLKKENNDQKKKISPYKEVIFQGSVFIKRKEDTVSADKAEFLVDKQVCKVDGNVKIMQSQKQANSMPIIIQSQRAYLDLTSEKLVLLGDQKKPVSTILALGADNKVPQIEQKSV